MKALKFRVGDLVLKRVVQSIKEKNTKKLRPNWEGPYTMVTRRGNGSYTSVDQDRKETEKQWNSFNLKHDPIIFKEKVHNCAPSFSQWYLRNASKSLYWVLTLTAKTYMEALLKDESAPDGHSYSLYWVLTWRLRRTRRFSIKMEALMTVTHIAYIRSSLWCLGPTRRLLKDRSTHDGHTILDSLCKILDKG